MAAKICCDVYFFDSSVKYGCCQFGLGNGSLNYITVPRFFVSLFHLKTMGLAFSGMESELTSDFTE